MAIDRQEHSLSHKSHSIQMVYGRWWLTVIEFGLWKIMNMHKVWYGIDVCTYEVSIAGGSFLLTWINPLMNNHIPNQMQDQITYPFLNFNGCTAEVWEWMSNFIPHC